MMDDDLTLEKLKIVQKLSDLEKSFIEVNANLSLINQTIQVMEKTVNKHSEEIWGNGSVGLKTGMDRLVQRNRIVNWFIGVMAAIIISLVSRQVYDVLLKMGG